MSHATRRTMYKNERESLPESPIKNTNNILLQRERNRTDAYIEFRLALPHILRHTFMIDPVYIGLRVSLCVLHNKWISVTLISGGRHILIGHPPVPVHIQILNKFTHL